MQYYVKIDEEYRPFPSKVDAIAYNEVIDGDEVFFSSDENKTQQVIDECVDKYINKKTKHIEVKTT